MKNLCELSNEELVDLFIKHGYSAERMDKELGYTKNTAARLFNKRGINREELIKNHKNQLIEEYNKNPKLCEYCGKPIPWEKRRNNFCSSSCAASKNNKGQTRNPKGKNGRVWAKKEKPDKKTKSAEITPKKEKVRLCSICGEENCTNEFCREHNLQQLNGLAKHVGLDKSSIGTTRVFSEFNRVRLLIHNLYWNQGYSRIDLGKEFNYPDEIMPMNVLKKTLGIPTRNQSDATKNALYLGKTSLPEINEETGVVKCNADYHETWEGKTVYLRSSYELDYANYLDENQISYSVEDLRIEYYDSRKNKMRIAVPDFYLSDTNEIVEIKSDFTLDIQEMLDKFEAYKKLGYVPKLILEKEEVDLENLENLISESRLDKIKNRNITSFKKQ